MDELMAIPGEVSCTIGGKRYREAAVYIATFLAHVQVFGEKGTRPFVTLASAGLSDDEARMLR